MPPSTVRSLSRHSAQLPIPIATFEPVMRMVNVSIERFRDADTVMPKADSGGAARSVAPCFPMIFRSSKPAMTTFS